MLQDSNTKYNAQHLIAALTAICLLQASLSISRGQDAETLAKRDQVLANWQTMNLSDLKRPENAPVLQELRRVSKEHPELSAREILISMGDQEAINDSLHDLRSAHPLNRSDAAGQIIRSGNANVIVSLIPDLNKPESPNTIRVDDMKMLPLSVQVASIIKGFIKHNSLFPPAVKTWADQLPFFGDGLRKPMRAWWQLNQAAFEQGHYGATVVPPSN